MRRRSVIALLAVLLLAGCGAGTPTPSSGEAPVVKVVAATTILADLTRQVGGDRIRVDSLVPKGGDVHTFDPRPSTIRRLAEADLVLLNGLGLDNWIGELVVDAGVTAPVVRLGEGLDGVTYLEGAHEGEDPAHEGADVNPHLWLDVAYARRYVERIGAQLEAVDPAGASEYRANLAAYTATLDALDATARRVLGAIPDANRTVVSFHDAFPYFAAAYGLRIDGTVVDAPGQEPSAGQVSALIRAIRANGVRAIFAEAQFNDELARTIADETGAVVVSDLFTDTVGDPPQDTYVGLMTWNIDRVAAALAGS